MAKFGQKSLERLQYLHPKLVDVLTEAIKETDFSVLCTYRDKTEQNRLFDEGKSQLRYPNSKHNRVPSHAVDIVPWPEQFTASEERWNELALCILKHAQSMDVVLNWGGFWKSFKDRPHFELKEGFNG